MTAYILNGATIAETIVAEVAQAAQLLPRPPGLAVVLVGENPASQVYVAAKGRVAKQCGFHSLQHTLPATVSEEDLLRLIDSLNDDPAIHGILVQLPLPPSIDATRVLQAVDPAKDVDGFHPLNVGLAASGVWDSALIPCTPAGAMILIDHAAQALGRNLAGGEAVIIGRSNIVGKPMAQLLLARNATVTIAHSRTQDLPAVVRRADVLVSAVGQAEMVRGDWVKPGAIVIDVGINRIPVPETGKTRLVGDVAFDEVAKIAGAITPVPGGVGKMTIAMLMKNTLRAAQAG